MGIGFNLEPGFRKVSIEMKRLWINISSFIETIYDIYKYGIDEALRRARQEYYEARMKHFELTGKALK